MKSASRTLPRLIIRTDGGHEIGMGHIYRSIILAEKFKKLGFEIHFIVSKNKLVIEKIKQLGVIHSVTNNEKSEIEIIKKINADIIIIDLLKNFFPKRNNAYWMSLKKNCKVLVSIDYSGNGSKYVDLGFHTLFKPGKMKAKKIFHDLKYCIIKKDFVKSGSSYNVKKRLNSIIILQGGSDTRCIIPRIINSLELVKSSFKITVVLGPAFDCWQNLETAIKRSHRKIKILHDIKKMHLEMKKHDLAISAAGNTMIELLSLGVPSVIVCGERHELEIANEMQHRRAIINLGYGPQLSRTEISSSIASLVKNFHKRQLLSSTSKKVIDGRGLDRVVQTTYSQYLNKKYD